MATAFHTKVLLRSEESNGAVSFVENVVPAAWEGPPLHRHHDFDETFFVLEGELTFQVDDALVSAAPGAMAFARRGVHHTLANLGDVDARYVLVCTPAGFERYFDRVAAEQAGSDPPESALQPYPETIMVGPPIAADATAQRQPRAPRGQLNVLLRSEETDGVLSLMDNDVSADAKGPYLHAHDFDECFYVIDGELTFQLEDRLLTVRGGEVAFAPRGIAHTFANSSGEPARFLLTCTPAGFERYFARMQAQEKGVPPPEWALQEIPAVTRVGPRIGEE